jgi:hypothetical protein
LGQQPCQSSIENRKSTGKVAHLPKNIRRVVNEMLDDGATYNEIVAKLAELGYPGFFYQNIQRWKNGGYKHWLRAQEQREETIIMTETALELAQEDPNTAAHLCEANEILLALKNHKLLQEIQDWDAETLLGTEKSKAYFQLSRSITHQLAQRTRRERFKFDVEWKTRKQEAAKQAEQQNGITPMTKEQRAYILDKMDEILGIKLDPAAFEDDVPEGSETPVGNEVTSFTSEPQLVGSEVTSFTSEPQLVGSEVTRFTSTPAAHGDTRQNTPTNLEPQSAGLEPQTLNFKLQTPGGSEGHVNTRQYTPAYASQIES